MIRLLRFISALVLLLAFVACAKQVHPLMLQFAEVDKSSSSRAREYVYIANDGSRKTVRLLDPVPFAVQDSSLTQDENGHAAVGFTLTQKDGERFRAWTGERIGRDMAVIVDEQVRMVATIRDSLPGGGWFSGGPQGFAPGEAERIVAGLKAGAKK